MKYADNILQTIGNTPLVKLNNITNDVKFNYSHDIKHSNNKLIKILFKIFFQIFKKQQNLLSIYIKVPNEAS